ncbi:hypothetical protein R6Q59_019807 [Mikania micrantha]|uniref:PWWP domain-containing protein n=1 Tax=Mikania micrantha TaxID=192012 RepID=A0A5N6PR67_9ASTR|nr:hypothetical protein E3N88_07300 [Mikania micrantha]
MGGLTDDTNVSLVESGAGKETENVQQSKEAHFGELLWAKLHEDSWWPAQIVDETLISPAKKPSSKGSSSDVLVRLYGSYVYKYVDIPKSSVEFKSILIKNNFNYHSLLKKSLEQDLPSLRSSKSRKKKQSKSKGKVVTEASQNGSSEKSPVSSRKRKQEKPIAAESNSQIQESKIENLNPTLDQVDHDTDPSTPNKSARRTQEPNARRVKVMQNLGLVAPSGSPYPTVLK